MVDAKKSSCSRGQDGQEIKKAEEKWHGPPALEAVMNEDVRDHYGYSVFSKALAEGRKNSGRGGVKDMIERAYYDDGAALVMDL